MDFSKLATIDYGSVLNREHFMHMSIRPLWGGMERIAGPAYTVQLSPGDNLMLHAAIYEAPKGSILVVDGVDSNYAVAGGNVCAIAQQRGIKGFIIDGVIRDVEEITDIKFPVYAKGVFPVPGKKQCYSELTMPITCGGVAVRTGDIVVADIEGIAVLPQEEAAEIYELAKSKFQEEAELSLDEWQARHKIKIETALAQARTK